eukprot:CAMPEP_0114597930 /NCGR_PEP_ID=MMETSP0125-20121206/20297_1 /TAXON_ID=485358 ORGANISM="Aristerostoma sp., Strain ATCC 50986" /NCGR_SAMPLE_ID=MMETSP0125 /ASSEMBLY_ACC=CAM_ASM_000245 /LENGTH=118 /DNA_ID=CAMNT_0001803147 /DNA_START=369 /DNA_END=725 /DNA_ORIENTATION=-
MEGYGIKATEFITTKITADLKAVGLKERSMEQEFIHFVAERISLEESGLMEKSKVRLSLTIVMDPSIKVDGTRVKKMDLVYIVMPMEIFMKVNGWKIKCMEKAPINMLVELFMKENVL